MRYLILILIFLANITWATATPPTPTEKQAIKVIYYHQAIPSALDQVSVAVWTSAAKTLNLPYILLPMTDLNKAIQLLKTNQAEILIGALTPSQDDPDIDYLNTYIPSNFGVLVNTYTKLNPIEKIWYLLKAFVGFSFAVLMLYMLIFSVLIWFVEHKGPNSAFPKKPIPGIGCAFWFTVTTFTTLGYGDYVPKTRLGRVITIIWILMSLILASTFIATMSSEVNSLELNANRISSSAQLQGQIIAYFSGNESARNSIQELGGIPIARPDWSSIVKVVKTQQAYAAIGNNILLRETLKDHPNANVKLANFTIGSGDFAFAIKHNNQYENDLAYVLYTLETTGQTGQLINNTVLTLLS